MLYSRAGTVKVVKKIRDLVGQGVQFAVFPETIVPYYPYFSFVQPPYTMAEGHLRLSVGGDRTVRRDRGDRRSRPGSPHGRLDRRQPA